MILPKDRAARFIMIRRRGPLTDADHRLLALWTAHVAAHELGVAACAIKDVRRPKAETEHAGRLEWCWQREQLLDAIRELA